MTHRRSILPILVAALAAAPATAQQQAQNLVYTAVAPCRVADTRLAVGGALAPGDVRTFHVVGSTSDFGVQGGTVGGCGLPGYLAGSPRITAVMFNFVAVGAEGPGNLRAWAFGSPPNASVINYVAGTTFANGVVVPVDQDVTEGADLRLRADVSGTHVVIDVLGYFSPLTLTDGPGSGLDADTLDGVEASAFAAAAHTHAGEAIVGGTVADARVAGTLARDGEVLPLVLAGDGSASTLDADRLDGLDSTAFQRRYAKVATVAVGGTGDYPDPVAAMAARATWCGTPSFTNRCLLRIMAGYYTITAPLVTETYVDVVGSGSSVTVVKRAGGTDPDTPAVIASGGGEIRELAIVSEGSAHALGVLMDNSDRTLRNVYVSAQGATDSATAVRVVDGSVPKLLDCFLIAYGPALDVTTLAVSGTYNLVIVQRSELWAYNGASSDCTAVDLSGNSQFELYDSRVFANSCATGTGIRSADPALGRSVRRSRISAGSSSVSNIGAHVAAGGNLSLQDSEVSGSAVAGPDAIGMFDASASSGNVLITRGGLGGKVALKVAAGSQPRVTQAYLNGSVEAIRTDAASAVVRVAYSQLGGAVAGTGTHQCLGAFTLNLAVLQANCQP